MQEYSRKLNAKVHREIAKARNRAHNLSVDYLSKRNSRRPPELDLSAIQRALGSEHGEDDYSTTDHQYRVSFIKRKTKESSTPAPATNREAVPLKVGDIKKFECKNIVEACYYLEHVEQYEKKPAEREMDKELILADIRNKKLNEMFDLLKEFEDASDPKSLKMMFIYKDIVNQEYDEE